MLLEHDICGTAVPPATLISFPAVCERQPKMRLLMVRQQMMQLKLATAEQSLALFFMQMPEQGLGSL